MSEVYTEIGDDVWIRQDVLAAEEGVTERTLNRGDRHGDPFVIHGGCKYRPLKGHQEYLAAKIQRRGK